MSRYSVQADSANITIIVGWDPPLKEFFAQVINKEAGRESDEMLLWESFNTVSGLRDAIAPFGQVPPELAEALERDAGKVFVRPEVVEFQGRTYRVRQGRYPHGGATWLQLINDGEEPVATATVNLPEQRISAEEALVKSWSENEGMLESLVAAGIVEDTGRTVPSGFVRANLVRVRSCAPQAPS